MTQDLSLTFNQVLDIETPPRTQIWGPAIMQGNLVIAYAPTGVGKSLWAWSLGYAAAVGGKFLNHVCPHAYKVLLIEGELGAVTTKKRLQMIQAASPYSVRGDHFRVLTKDQTGGTLWNMSEPEMQRRYNAQIGDADLIIIDNLMVAAAPLNRHDDEIAMWNRLAPWLFMLRDSGRTVIMVAHTNKTGVFAGVQTKMNLMDTVIELRPPETLRPIPGTEFEIHYRKTRDTKKTDALPLHVEYCEGEDGVSRWTWRPLEDSQQKMIQQMKGEGLTRREVAKQLGLSYREVQYAWDKWEVAA